MSKISGPLLDRIAINIEVPAVKYGEAVPHCGTDLASADSIRPEHISEVIQ